ncbi:MAG: YhdH/YhfP family quinone oxidoreductase [Prolixibacteraceae bacterium]|nr:YhdH/YhfP family quinone oxidoreductase [Burkholderiales bacterium]
MQTFRAFRSHHENGRVTSRLDQVPIPAIKEGEVLIQSAWSGINYKDALAATGTGKIMKQFPTTVGIDAAGVVHASKDGRFKVGDQVLVVGCGLGEEYDGGFAEFVQVKGDWIVHLPGGLSMRESMAIGTAGFTAALAVQRMEDNGQTPSQGSILVTGATGGVGSLAIDIMASSGYSVIAATSKGDQDGYLRSLGAREILLTSSLEMGTRPLEKALYAGAIDNLGGPMLSWLTRVVQPLGNIASIGLASGPAVSTTVMPFILRGINLLGINSTYTPAPLRQKVWSRLASDLRPRHLGMIANREVELAELPSLFDAYPQGNNTGRTLVRIA